MLNPMPRHACTAGHAATAVMWEKLRGRQSLDDLMHPPAWSPRDAVSSPPSCEDGGAVDGPLPSWTSSPSLMALSNSSLPSLSDAGYGGADAPMPLSDSSGDAEVEEGRDDAVTPAVSPSILLSGSRSASRQLKKSVSFGGEQVIMIAPRAPQTSPSFRMSPQPRSLILERQTAAADSTVHQLDLSSTSCNRDDSIRSPEARWWHRIGSWVAALKKIVVVSKPTTQQTLDVSC